MFRLFPCIGKKNEEERQRGQRKSDWLALTLTIVVVMKDEVKPSFTTRHTTRNASLKLGITSVSRHFTTTYNHVYAIVERA